MGINKISDSFIYKNWVYSLTCNFDFWFVQSAVKTLNEKVGHVNIHIDKKSFVSKEFFLTRQKLLMWSHLWDSFLTIFYSLYFFLQWT